MMIANPENKTNSAQLAPIDSAGGRAYTSKSNMRPSAFLLLAALCVRGVAAVSAATPDPGLLRLEAALTQKLGERKSGALPPDQYRLFAEKFRADLDAVLARAPESPLNRGRHALILARLDEAAPGQAIAGLDQALEANPGNGELLNAKGAIQLQQGDYAGALASADAVLKRNAERGEEPDPAAVSLRHFSKGRGAPTAGARTDPYAAASPELAAATQDGRQPVQLTQRQVRARVEIPSIAGEDAGVENENPGVVANPIAWTKGQVERAPRRVGGWVKKTIGIRPGEEQLAHTGASYGAVTGAAFGVGLGVVAIGPCSPGGVLGGYPVYVCAAVAGSVAVAIFTPIVAYAGAVVNVNIDRFQKMVLKSDGTNFTPEQEE